MIGCAWGDPSCYCSMRHEGMVMDKKVTTQHVLCTDELLQWLQFSVTLQAWESSVRLTLPTNYCLFTLFLIGRLTSLTSLLLLGFGLAWYPPILP
ncbi:hypothetical protein BDW67DRAFT_55142 [Aspergillus spinulosporus]